ncbi:MAG: hypothetical protein WCI76_01730 [bacterium]
MKIILVDAVFCFIQETQSGFEVFKDLYDLLEKYPNRKIILTGADDEGVKKYGLDNVPYEFFTLKHNPEKTNPEYYRIFLKNFNLNKEEGVYFEQNVDAVKSARSVGINTYFYDDNKKDLVDLKKFLDENLR